MSHSLQLHGLWPIRLLCPWDFLGKSAGVDCHFLLQGIFPTQDSNPGLPYFRQMVYRLSHEGRSHYNTFHFFFQLIFFPSVQMHGTISITNWTFLDTFSREMKLMISQKPVYESYTSLFITVVSWK